MNYTTKHYSICTEESKQLLIDSGCDTSAIGGSEWIIEDITQRTVSVIGYQNTKKSEDIPIGSAITAVDLPDKTTILIKINEATLLGEHGNSLLSPLQARNYGTTINDIPKSQGGLPHIKKDGIVIPITLKKGLLTIPIRKPTEYELHNTELIVLTSDEIWEPENLETETLSSKEYDSITNDDEDSRFQMLQWTRTRPKDIKQAEEFLLHPGKEATTKTLQATTQLGKISHRIPTRPHLKTRDPILSCTRLMELWSTDTWFFNVTSYEGYNCAQLFAAKKSRRVCNYGLTTEAN